MPKGPVAQTPPALPSELYYLDVVVERDLVGVRPDLHGQDLVLTLVGDPGLDQVLGENATLGEVFVILLELVDDRGQRRRGLRDAGGLVRRQLVEVLVDGCLGLDLLLDA